MSKPGKRDQHLDIRVNGEEMTDILRRVPPGAGTADWVRAELLDRPIQRGRVVHTKAYRDLTPYKDRLRSSALLSIASSLGWIARSPLDPATHRKLEVVLGLVRHEILKEDPSC